MRKFLYATLLALLLFFIMVVYFLAPSSAERRAAQELRQNAQQQQTHDEQVLPVAQVPPPYAEAVQEYALALQAMPAEDYCRNKLTRVTRRARELWLRHSLRGLDTELELRLTELPYATTSDAQVSGGIALPPYDLYSDDQLRRLAENGDRRAQGLLGARLVHIDRTLAENIPDESRRALLEEGMQWMERAIGQGEQGLLDRLLDARRLDARFSAKEYADSRTPEAGQEQIEILALNALISEHGNLRERVMTDMRATALQAMQARSAQDAGRVQQRTAQLREKFRAALADTMTENDRHLLNAYRAATQATRQHAARIRHACSVEASDLPDAVSSSHARH